MSDRNSKMYIKNPHFKADNVDILYHFGLNTETHDFVKLFGDVKFVCCGGSAKRMEKLANTLSKEISPTAEKAANISQSERFVMYKVGPVLCVNHGMGTPSISIMLHELFKLLHHARCKDVLLFRVGTSGGIGIPPGTIVVTEQGYNGLLLPEFSTECIGKVVSYPTVLDLELCEELSALASSLNLPATKGKSLCGDFYEGQGRIDGAFCSYTENDKVAFLQKAASLGIKNFEMEVTALAALSKRAGIKAAVICVTLLDRLKGDQVTLPKSVLENFEDRPCVLVTTFIKKRLLQQSNKIDNHCANGGGC